MQRLALAVLSLTLATACVPGPATLSDEDVASISGIASSYVEAYMAKDLDAVVASYTDDAVEMPPDSPENVGMMAINDFYDRAFEIYDDMGQLTLTSQEIEGMDGLAYDRGTWSWTGVMPEMTDTTTVIGKYLVIARRQESGVWLWTRMIWNEDQESPQPE